MSTWTTLTSPRRYGLLAPAEVLVPLTADALERCANSGTPPTDTDSSVLRTKDAK